MLGVALRANCRQSTWLYGYEWLKSFRLSRIVSSMDFSSGRHSVSVSRRAPKRRRTCSLSGRPTWARIFSGVALPQDSIGMSMYLTGSPVVEEIVWCNKFGKWLNLAVCSNLEAASTKDLPTNRYNTWAK